MDIRNVDLNLLVIFDAMARHRSVIRTAELVGLSQPATSAALARLRILFEDALFVRAGSEMKPTPRALELAPAVHRVVDAINSDILQQAAFDPARAERTFTILTPDIGEIAFIPGVLKRLRHEAPDVRLHAVSMPRKAAAEALASGQAELAVGFFPDLQKAGFFQQGLFKMSYVCIACASNRQIDKRMTMKQFLAAKHVVVSPDGREHTLDRVLEEKGHHRRVMLELSHFMSLVAILPNSDFIATVPDDIATAVERYIKVQRIELPLHPPTIDVQLFWHRRMQDDSANKWLRGMFYAVNRRDSGLPLPASTPAL
jgi:DNA-binding transcriptional LysR family regulator